MQGAFCLYLTTVSDLTEKAWSNDLLLLEAGVGIYAIAVNLIDLVFEVNAGGWIADVVLLDFFFIFLMILFLILIRPLTIHLLEE
jgi:hypothetical protein